MRHRRVVSDLTGFLKLARCSGLGTQRAHTLLQHLPIALVTAGGDPLRSKLKQLELPRKLINALCGRQLQRRIDDEQRVCEKHGFTLIGMNHPCYPESVRNLSVPPLVLAVRGELSALGNTGVGIVGSRQASGYGIANAMRLAGELADCGVAIVSGLARGIDKAAHQAALDVHGITVAVMGTGCDRIYPREHRKLADAIAERGALVTEFAPGTPPLRENFPRRNRIIAGLSLAVVIVEATERSGSLVTARWALDENRPLLAVPGRIGEPASTGPLGLLRAGAAIALTAEDVLAQIPPPARPCVPTVENDRQEQVADEQRQTLAKINGVAPASASVLDAMPQHDPISLDEILHSLSQSTDELLTALFALEMAGLIEALPGARYRRRLNC